MFTAADDGTLVVIPNAGTYLGQDIDFRVGDAQDVPFPDDGFDVVLSVYGVQFAPDQERAARELLRVYRPGGKIGLAGPIPEGWSGN